MGEDTEKDSKTIAGHTRAPYEAHFDLAASSSARHPWDSAGLSWRDEADRLRAYYRTQRGIIARLRTNTIFEHEDLAYALARARAPARRSMLRAAHQHLQWGEASHGVAVARRASPIDVVADLMHINRLLGRLSQTILAAPEAGTPGDRERTDIDAARRIGSKRLWYFAESMPRPTLDREYVTSGRDLLDALADLAEIAPRRGTTPDVCLALMITLVETSRHATHVAWAVKADDATRGTSSAWSPATSRPLATRRCRSCC